MSVDFNTGMNAVPWLEVVGTRIVAASTGEQVTLRGVNVMRSEWNKRSDGSWYRNMDFERAGIPIIANQWKGNVILRGFASDPVNSADSEYLGVLDEYVSLAEANRIYIIFAWRSHSINGDQPHLPDERATQALIKLAGRYRGKPNVIYALQVEPHNVTWDAMQPEYIKMIDAIRMASTPYKPIIMIPGVNWSRDISGAISNPVIRENVVYKSHPYNIQSQFQQQFIDTYNAGLPVFIGEFGWIPNKGPAEGMQMSDVNALLTITRQRNIGWAAWIFDDLTQYTSLVVKDSNFEATSQYGIAVKNEMMATPPLPTNTGALAINVDDAAFDYTGIWHTSSGPAKFLGGDHYSDTEGSTYQVSFTGSQARLYAPSAPWHGIAEVSIDGAPEATVDFYSPSRIDQAHLYSSPTLGNGLHTLTVRVTGTKNASSTGTVVPADRVSIITGSVLIINDNTIGSNENQFEYSDGWSYSSGTPKKYEGDDHYSNSTGSTVRIVVSGTQIKLYGSTAPWHGIAEISIDGGKETMVDYYSPVRKDDVALYNSPGLAVGSHTLSIKVTGTKNAAATDAVITIDRIEVSTASHPTSYLSTTYDEHGFFHHKSGESDYVGYRPDTYIESTPISLFVWMHGCGGIAEGDLWKVAPPATRATQNYIAISIGGRDKSCWKVSIDGSKILAAVKDVQRYFNINPRQVYVGGYSSGGDMAYRHGLQNSGMFAGILAENSDPFMGTGSTPEALMASSDWKINIGHVAHTQDLTYPIETVRESFAILKANTFPVTLIEKAGTHYDPSDEIKKTGTDYDLIHSLLPFLDSGWMSP